MTSLAPSSRRTLTPLIRVAVVLALVLVSVMTNGVVAARADSYDPITGSGSTWSQNALDQWRKNVQANYGMTVNYSGTGSSAGRRDFITGSVDFAVSEIPFQTKPEDGSAPEKPPRGFAYMPIVAGGTSFMYNLKIGGKLVRDLRLSGPTVTKIFTGVITNWNDPAIQADNPDLVMPDKGIVPVVRSDGSGSTAQFTLWMSKQHSALWNAFCVATGRATAGESCGLTSQYPTYSGFKAQSGSSGVAGYVSQAYGEGSITYVEYSYAKEANFPVAKVKNAAGKYVEPTGSNVATALLKAVINTDASSADYLTQNLEGVYNAKDPAAYPLSSYSYMIVPTEVGGIFTEKKGKTLGTFASYMLCKGQAQAEPLGYSPLPVNLVLAAFEQIKRIPGAESVDTGADACKDPTLVAGDPDPDSTTAPGTATGTDATTPEAAAAAAAAASAGGTGVAASYDENGALISGSGVVGVAAASPFTLPDEGWGAQQSTMLFAGLLLVAAAVMPPLLWRRLGRGHVKADTK